MSVDAVIDAEVDRVIEPMYDVGRWLPHGAGMVLIDHVARCDHDGLLATSTRHRGPAHPLADGAGNVAALHLLEYAAQAAAIHLGVTQARAAAAKANTAEAQAANTSTSAARTGAARDDPGAPPAQVAPGVIAFVRELWFGVPHIGQYAPPLHVEVQRRAAIPGGVAYAFTARLAADEIAAPGSDPTAGDRSADAAPLARGVFGVVLGVSGLGSAVSDAPASESVAPRVSAGNEASSGAPFEAAAHEPVAPVSSSLPAMSTPEQGREVN